MLRAFLQADASSLSSTTRKGVTTTTGRTLAYIWLDGPRPTLFNKEAVRRGFSLEYAYDSTYQWQSLFQRAERRARSQKRGVWLCPTPGS